MSTQRIDDNDRAAGVEDPLSGLDIKRYLRILTKRKLLILIVFIVVLGLVAVWTFSQTRIYMATASVIVSRKAPQVLGKEVREVVELSPGDYWWSKEYMQTQRMVITSKDLARKVADELNLANDKAFWEPFIDEEEGKKIRRTLDDAAGALQGMVSAEVVKNSDVIEISVEHADKDIAAKLANAVAHMFLNTNVEYKLSSTSGAVKWLANRLDDLKQEVEQAELSLYQFKKSNNIIAVSLEERQSLIAQTIETYNKRLTDLRVKRLALEAQRKQIARVKGKSPMEIALDEVINSPIVRDLKSIYIAEQRKLVPLQEKYLEHHPLVRQQAARANKARIDLEREVTNELEAVELRYQKIKDNETKLAAALQTAKNEALELNKKSVDYRRLERNQKNKAKLYSMVLTRMTESDLSGQLRVNNIRLLDRAETTGVPVRPRVNFNLALGGLLGLLLGIALAFLVEAMDSSIKSQEDIQLIPRMTYLGMLPQIPGTSHKPSSKRPEPDPQVDLIVHRTPKSVVAESCRAIRTNLLFASPDTPTKSVLISSAGPREGKTTIAVSLAITMAQAGSRVLIVDTDMRRPRMHKIFGVPGGKGIASVLLGSDELDDVIKTTEVPNLYVLPCGPTPPNPAEVCQSDRFRTLLEQLVQRYDRVILDSPPVMVVTDAVVLSTQADGVMLVARSGLTSKEALGEANRQLLDVGANMLGCVLNDLDLERRKYGYYRYRRYGYHRYGYYRYGHYENTEEESSAG